MEPWEVEVFERIKSADEDQSGTINVKELFGVIKGAAEADRQKRLFRRLFIATVVLLLIMLAANMALTAAVVFLAKDTVTNSTGVTMTPSGTRSRLPFQQRSPASEIIYHAHPLPLSLVQVNQSARVQTRSAQNRRQLERADCTTFMAACSSRSPT